MRLFLSRLMYRNERRRCIQLKARGLDALIKNLTRSPFLLKCIANRKRKLHNTAKRLISVPDSLFLRHTKQSKDHKDAEIWRCWWRAGCKAIGFFCGG